MSINGVINVYKDKGITSFSLVREVKKAAGADKAGHTGTLDPLASGVLPVCLGKATRLSGYLMQKDKTYEVGMYIGVSTDTFDLEGRVTAMRDSQGIGEKDVIECIKSFTGESLQVPPAHSAIKVGGRKMYEYARKGIEITPEPRKINILSIENIRVARREFKGINVIEAGFTVQCTKGTYIRSLCSDIGTALGSFGVMTGLERLASGNFTKAGASTLDEIRLAAREGRIEELILDAADLTGLDRLRLDQKETADYMNGIKLCKSGSKPGEYLVESFERSLIGIGVINDEGILKGRKRLS
ncbi:MAG: tRNA pseudouridine(55) synthase TruB [Clostridia bacterium]|nr:tRNA pseudouridine(55) synthase TruB [Clostridia bacterium]